MAEGLRPSGDFFPAALDEKYQPYDKQNTSDDLYHGSVIHVVPSPFLIDTRRRLL
jgi:hypothetical protein